MTGLAGADVGESVVCLGNTPAQERPVLAVTLTLIGLSLVCLYAVVCVVKHGSAWATTRTIITFAVAMRCVALFSTPIQEIDYYRYLWDGETVLAGVNPFQVSPEQALTTSPNDRHAPEHLRQLAELIRQRPRVHETAARVHYGHLPTIYPPVSLAVFAIATLMTPESASLPARCSQSTATGRGVGRNRRFDFRDLLSADVCRIHRKPHTAVLCSKPSANSDSGHAAACSTTAQPRRRPAAQLATTAVRENRFRIITEFRGQQPESFSDIMEDE